MTKKLGVFIGRFQPFHNGHLYVINEALKQVDDMLILIGSTGEPRTYHNPFTAPERITMIYDALERPSRVAFREITDFMYNDAEWCVQVQNVVNQYNIDTKPKAQNLAEVYLVGHSKDHSSYYLKMFPQWKSISIDNFNGINSTDIRRSYFGIEQGGIPTIDIPRNVARFLVNFQKTPEYKYLKEETDYITAYRKAWADAPYPPTFVTVDACVIQSAHVLLVRRRSAPGKGLWALPGGFLNQRETIEKGMLRELREETKLKVPEAVLRGNIKTVKVFDHPDRSPRGRIITHAHLIHLPGDVELPKVKGSDDADKAKWVPLSEVKREMMFEDHWSIINNLTGEL